MTHNLAACSSVLNHELPPAVPILEPELDSIIPASANLRCRMRAGGHWCVKIQWAAHTGRGQSTKALGMVGGCSRSGPPLQALTGR